MDRSRIAGSNYHYKRFTFDYFLKAAAKAGYTSLELWASGPNFHMEDYSDARLKELRKKIEDLGMTVKCLTPETYVYPISVSNPDPIYRKRSVEFFKRHIEAASILGCDRMLATPGFSCLDIPREEGLKWCRECFAEIAKKAEQHKVMLTLEGFTTYTTNVINTGKTIRETIDYINSPYFKGMVDVDVIANSGLETIDNFIRDLGPENIYHVHFVDGLPGGHLVPGEGKLDMVYALKAIEATGYKGVYGMELLDRRYIMDPDKAMVDYLAWFDKQNV